MWSDIKCSSEPEPYDNFRVLQEFGNHLLEIFSRSDATIMGIHQSIKVKVDFVRPPNVPWIRITNRHSHEKLLRECFESVSVVPYQLQNSLTLMRVKVQIATHDVSDRGVMRMKTREI